MEEIAIFTSYLAAAAKEGARLLDRVMHDETHDERLARALADAVAKLAEAHQALAEAAP